MSAAAAAAAIGDDNNNNNNDQENNKKYYTSFLTFTWGIIADIDIESERLHWMGVTRYDVWAVLCVLKYRSYRATFRYTTTATKDDDDPSTWTTIEDDFVYFMASQVSHVSVCYLRRR